MRKAAAFFLIIALFCLAPVFVSYASDGRWPGVDEAVVEKYAAEHGQSAKPGLINLEGDTLLFAFLLAGAAGGFAAGYYYRDLFSIKSRTAGEK